MGKEDFEGSLILHFTYIRDRTYIYMREMIYYVNIISSYLHVDTKERKWKNFSLFLVSLVSKFLIPH